MTELPDYLKELEELEKKQCYGPWELDGLFVIVRDQNGNKLLGPKIADLTEQQTELFIQTRNAIPRILSDFKKLQKDKASNDEDYLKLSAECNQLREDKEELIDVLSNRIGPWMSAALEDEKVGKEMKEDINSMFKVLARVKGEK